MSSTTRDGLTGFSPRTIIHFFVLLLFRLLNPHRMTLLLLEVDISMLTVTLRKFHSMQKKLISF